jgi:hypothetical protein
VTERGKNSRDRVQAPALARFRALARQAPRRGNHLGRNRLCPLTVPGLPPLALPGRAKLAHELRLLELAEAPRICRTMTAAGVSSLKCSRAVARHQLDTQALQHLVAGELNRKN